MSIEKQTDSIMLDPEMDLKKLQAQLVEEIRAGKSLLGQGGLLTPLIKSALKAALEGELFAVIMAEAMNHGLPKMADICDIPYHTLKDAKKQYLRLATLKAANDIISNRIKTLGIFPYYELGFDKRYGSMDGQKYEVERPTTKARYSKKYFGKGRGVVAYTLLCNHVPLQTDTMSAHEHKSY